MIGVKEAGGTTADRGKVMDRCGWLAEVSGWTTISVDMGVTFSPVGWSDPAHVELTPMPMVKNAMARVHAAITKAFATAV